MHFLNMNSWETTPWFCYLSRGTLMLDFIWILLVILVSCLSFLSTGRCEELRRQSRRWIEDQLQQGDQFNWGCRSECEDESRASKRRSQARSRRHQRRCQEDCRSHKKLRTEHCKTLNSGFNRIFFTKLWNSRSVRELRGLIEMLLCITVFLTTELTLLFLGFWTSSFLEFWVDELRLLKPSNFVWQFAAIL